MESEDNAAASPSYKKIFQIFRDFMTRITQFEELGNVGNRFLVSFQQGLDFLRRPPIDMNSNLVGQIIKANQSKRLSSYIEAGCVKTHDSRQNLSKLHTCHLGLLDCLNRGKSLMKKLESFIDDATIVIQNYNDNLSHLAVKDALCNLDSAADKELSLSDLQNPEITEYAALMAGIYGMVKQDCNMQERIISSLSLKSSSGELESYCLMWSLRPFIDDEIMHKAWRLVV